MTASGRSFTVDDLLDTRVPTMGHRPTLSPCGGTLASTWSRNGDYSFREMGDLARGRSPHANGAEIWLTDVATASSRRLLDPGRRSWSPSWSPNGRSLVFLSDATGRVNVWVWDEEHGARPVCDDQVYAGLPATDNPAWTADGAHVVVLLRKPEWRGDASGTRVEAGVTVEVFESERMEGPTIPGYRPLPAEPLDIGVIDVAAGAATRVDAPDGSFGVLPSPDGRWVKVLHRYSRPDMTKWFFMCAVSIVDTTAGTSRPVVEATDMGRALGSTWTPDSRALLMDLGGWKLIRGAGGDVTDAPLPAGASPVHWHAAGRLIASVPAEEAAEAGSSPAPTTLCSIAMDSTAPTPLDTRGSLRNVLRPTSSPTCWSPDGASCIVSTSAPSGDVELWRVPLDGGAATLLSTRDRPLSPTDVGGDDTVVLSHDDEGRPPSYWVTSTMSCDEREITPDFNTHLDGIAMAKVETVAWRTVEGREAKGFIMLPPTGERPCPVVAVVYPFQMDRTSASWGDMGLVHHQLLAAEGFAVFIPDASPGTGLELAGWVLPGLHSLAERGLVDIERMGVIGQSFGGSVVNRLVTATKAFKAAVSAAGAANEVSLHGQFRVLPDGVPNLYGVHIAEMFVSGPPTTVPLDYVRHSPVFSAASVDTPLLLVYGVDDTTVGVEQGGEMFTALRRHGKKVTFLRYVGEGHVPTQYTEPNRRDMYARVLRWLTDHLGRG